MPEPPALFPKINDKTKRIRKITKNTFANEAAPDAIPPKPKMAAMMAITKKVTVQRNIIVDLRIMKFYLVN